MRLEFGNEEHARLAREAEEEAARREAGIRRWRVGFVATSCGEVEVEALTAAEARRLIEDGDVEVGAGDFEDVDVVSVSPVEPDPPSGPEQPVFPFALGGEGEAL